MVVLKVKGKGERDVFLVEAPLASPVDAVVREVVEIWNLRLRLRWYVTNGRELAKATGCEALERACEEASGYLAAERAVAQRRPCLRSELEEHVRLLRGAAAIALPSAAGVPLEQLRREVEGLGEEGGEDLRLRKQYTLQILSDDPASGDYHEVLDPQTAVMWFASKELHRDKTLGDFLGRNEKTTALVKLTPTNAHPPGKEPPVDSEMQRDMMAYWYRKQEEEKRLTEDDDIHWSGSQWADPRALKTAFQGLKDLRIK